MQNLAHLKQEEDNRNTLERTWDFSRDSVKSIFETLGMGKKGQAGGIGFTLIISVVGVVFTLSLLSMVIWLIAGNVSDQLIILNQTNGSDAIIAGAVAVSSITGWFGLFILFGAIVFIVVLVGIIFRLLFAGGGIFGMGGGRGA